MYIFIGFYRLGWDQDGLDFVPILAQNGRKVCDFSRIFPSKILV